MKNEEKKTRWENKDKKGSTEILKKENITRWGDQTKRQEQILRQGHKTRQGQTTERLERIKIEKLKIIKSQRILLYYSFMEARQEGLLIMPLDNKT